MKEKILLFLLSVLTLTPLFGCAAQDAAGELDVDCLSRSLLETAELEDDLFAVDDTMIRKLYHIDDYTQASLYLSSGATAEEIAVFAFAGKEAAAAGLRKAQVRLEEKTRDFASYIPKEVPKLERAAVMQTGRYVIVCVSSGGSEEVAAQCIRAQNGG